VSGSLFGQVPGGWVKSVRIVKSNGKRFASVTTLSTNTLKYSTRSGRAKLTVNGINGGVGLILNTFIPMKVSIAAIEQSLIDDVDVTETFHWYTGDEDSRIASSIGGSDKFQQLADGKTLTVKFSDSRGEIRTAIFNLEELASYADFLEIKLKK
jgi:hypothetical protein